jgi:hypothetical protein
MTRYELVFSSAISPLTAIQLNIFSALRYGDWRDLSSIAHACARRGCHASALVAARQAINRLEPPVSPLNELTCSFFWDYLDLYEIYIKLHMWIEKVGIMDTRVREVFNVLPHAPSGKKHLIAPCSSLYVAAFAFKGKKTEEGGVTVTTELLCNIFHGVLRDHLEFTLGRLEQLSGLLLAAPPNITDKRQPSRGYRLPLILPLLTKVAFLVSKIQFEPVASDRGEQGIDARCLEE